MARTTTISCGFLTLTLDRAQLDQLSDALELALDHLQNGDGVESIQANIGHDHDAPIWICASTITGALYAEIGPLLFDLDPENVPDLVANFRTQRNVLDALDALDQD